MHDFAAGGRRPWVCYSAWIFGFTASGCAAVDVSDADFGELPAGWEVHLELSPSPPWVGVDTTARISVTENGSPVQDLQATHERIVHTFLVPRDLSSFRHVHQEDLSPITAENLANGQFAFPVRFETSGDYLFAFDYAARNVYRSDRSWVTVGGDAPQAVAADLEPSSEAVVGDVTAALTWDVPPIAGAPSAFRVSYAHDDGSPVTDLVPWLGADAHAALFLGDATWNGHTHAYAPGMENAPPGHEMPHLYSGPEVPFRVTFPSMGAYKLWVQVAREASPERAITAAFVIEVE